jgi:hypothetical protein
MRILKYLLATLLSLPTLGCYGESYSVSVRNMTQATITDAHVSFDGFRSIGGTVDPGIYKSNVDVQRPIPEEATVEWRTSDNVSHRRVVKVRSAVPARFRGEIFFEIMPDGTVKVVPRTDLP